MLIVAVSAFHFCLPWLLGLSSRQIDFAGRPPAETVTLTTRRIVQEPLPQAPSAEPPTDKPLATEPPPAQTRLAAARPSTKPSEPAAATPPAEQPAAPLDDTGGEGGVLYAVSGQLGGRPIGGSARLQWKIEPDAYLMSLHVTGSHQYTTVFTWQLKTRGSAAGGELQPEAYDEERWVASEGRQSRSIEFKGAPTQETAGPRLDPLTALLQLGSDLHARDTPPPGTPATDREPYPIVVRIAERSLHLSFERQGEEELSTPFGPLRTEKYVTKYANAFHDNPQVSLWLAPGFHHALVRLLIEQPDLAVLSFDLSSEPVAFPALRR